MKKYLLPLFAAFAFTVGTAAAQTTTTTTDAAGMQGRGYGRQQGSPEEMAKRQTERMTQELGLSADQATKVQQIMMARGQEMQAMRGQGQGGDREAMRTQMQANREKYDAQFKEVLTADQYTKYTTMQADRMNRGGGGRGPGMDGSGIEKMKAKTDGGDKVKMKEDKLKLKSAKSEAKDGKLKVKAE